VELKICTRNYRELPLMLKFSLNEAPSNIEVSGSYHESCELLLSEKSLSAISNRSLKVKINCKKVDYTVSDLVIKIGAVSGKINIVVGGNGANLTLEDGTKGNYDFRMYRNSLAKIGANTTSNGILLHLKDSDFICGEDCMFSSHIIVQGSDQHGIIDLDSGEIINKSHNRVELGNHVWLGRQCTLTPSAKIGDGSIVATGAIVTKVFAKNVLVAGVPAKIIKMDCTWSRSTDNLDYYSKQIIKEHRIQS